MATPPTTNQEFIREVDEQVRMDAALGFWRRWGRVLLAAIVVALLAFGGFLWWRSSQEASAGVEGERLSTALTALSANNVRKAEPELRAVADGKGDGYRAVAKLSLAAIAMSKNDLRAAAGQYANVADDTELAPPFRDLATIRRTAAEFDTMKPADVVARLRPLAVAGNPWFGSAGEMTAIAYLKMNRTREAGALYAALAKDEGVPETIRSRSIQLAGVLGVDVPPPARRGAGS